MKKLHVIAFLLAFGLLWLCGCADAQAETADAPIALTVSLQEGSLTGSSAVLVLENTSEAYTYEYGDTFGLEQKVGDEWQTVEPVLDVASTADLYLLLPGETREETVNLERKYGTLSAGEYRIVKVFEEAAADDSEEGERTERTVYVNFTV